MTIRRRLVIGFLVLFALAALGVAVAVDAARQSTEAVRGIARLTEDGRRLARVGALVREFSMHQSHLTLGMDRGEHLGHSRHARHVLAEAVARLAETDPLVERRVAIDTLRARLATLDAMFERRFLPALDAGRRDEARAVHDAAVAEVQALVAGLEADQAAVAEAIAEAERTADERARAATARAAAALGAALLVALGVAVWVGRTVSGPVGRLTAAAGGLAEAPAGTRVPEDGPPEVAALGATLNRVLGELEAQRRARVEAETLAALGRVAGGVAHEINNPLGVILGHARLVERAGGATAADAEAIAREARQCQAIVQQLLDYARPGVLRRDAIEPAEAAALAAERVDGVALTCADPLPPLAADRQRLDQVLYNLLQNARQFGEAITLEVAPHAGGVRFRVRDDGPGVTAADVERIFEPFYTTRPEGTGLGLAIARSVALAHGGSLRAVPAEEAGGGCFDLWLPAAGHGIDGIGAIETTEGGS